jgi:hypothetical protein
MGAPLLVHLRIPDWADALMRLVSETALFRNFCVMHKPITKSVETPWGRVNRPPKWETLEK